LTEPGTLTVFAKVKDANGGISTTCSVSTGTWTNLAPTASNLNQSTTESTNIIFTGSLSDPGGLGTPFTYSRYAGATCAGTSIGSSASYTTGRTEPGTIVVSYS